MEQFSGRESTYREQANVERKTRHNPLKQIGDFDVVREIGRGGMGVVYEAIDRTLQRRVALKVLHQSALATQKHVERFRRESHLAAQLHHTNIVSVFGVGEEGDSHFYAMQYVDGVSLHDIICGFQNPSSESVVRRDSDICAGLEIAKSLQESDSADSRHPVSDFSQTFLSEAFSPAESTLRSGVEQTIELDAVSASNAINAVPSIETKSQSHFASTAVVHQLGPKYWNSVARLGIQVAHALHHAHSNGILHRDIKPANLLIDAKGTVWVADFGLAKLNTYDDLTKTGDVVGTLKYMAPEQLGGRADERTDVHALGQTLYELLAFRPTCTGETYKDIFAQKQSPQVAPIRNAVPSIPRDLDTIVQKALEFDPSKRYTTAKALANDLQRFLDDRPIKARRVTSIEHVWRWCRRNRIVATLGATTACLFLLLPFVLGWAYMQKSAQNEQIESTLKAALTGFDEIFSPYAEDESATALAFSDSSSSEIQNLAPAMLTQDTARVLEGILKFYDRLAMANVGTNDVDLATESARARRRVGELYQRLGQFEKAIAAYQDALMRYSNLAKRTPGLWIEIARIYQSVGSIHAEQQQHKLARQQYELAFELLNSKDLGEGKDYELARTHYSLGQRVVFEGDDRSAPFGAPVPPSDENESERVDHLRKAVKLLEGLGAREENANPTHRLLLALCLRDMDNHHQASGDDYSERSQAVDLLERLVEDYPNVPQYRFELSELYRGNHPGPHGGVPKPQGRMEQLHKARELSEGLVDEHRNIASYRIHLAHVYAHLGIVYGTRGDLRGAEEFSRKACKTHESVIADFPGLAALSSRLSNNDKVRLADGILQLHRWEEVIELLQPLAEKLDESLKMKTMTELDAADARFTLYRCAELLQPAYEGVGDDVGYVVANAWLSDLSLEDEMRLAAHNAGLPLAGGRRGPPDPRRRGGPRGRPPRGRDGGFFPPPHMLGPKHRSHELADLSMSYDQNHDRYLTRDELPTRMGKEWFSRVDKNYDGEVHARELRDFFEDGDRR